MLRWRFSAVVALFMTRDRQGEPLITWREAAAIPWGVLLLFAGGICLAKAFVSSGLSTIAGENIVALATLPVFWMTLLICLSVTFMTEATSNTATTALLMPILAAAALSAGIDPILLMIPAAMSASCAFIVAGSHSAQCGGLWNRSHSNTDDVQGGVGAQRHWCGGDFFVATVAPAARLSTPFLLGKLKRVVQPAVMLNTGCTRAVLSC